MGKRTRKARDIENFPKATREALKDNVNYQGVNASNVTEPVPKYIKADGEKVYANKNNAWIVLGRDRPSSRDTGYGGAGGTQCASIDLVTGRMSSVKGGPKSNIFVDPNFTADAARIYISQKTDIDKNFDLVPGGVGMSKAKSGIGIKADAVRIIGREGIKLVTNTDKKNSQGGKIKSTFGIDLIAGNDDARQKIKGSLFGKDVNFLQPLVKGDNLTAALVEITQQLGDLATRFDQFAKAQMRYNTALSLHTHPVVGFVLAIPSVELTPSFLLANIQQFTNCMATSWSQSKNLSNFRINYLYEYGDRWICSRFNRTT
jgi:hypothetical protein